jgi:hypothetical protein
VRLLGDRLHLEPSARPADGGVEVARGLRLLGERGERACADLSTITELLADKVTTPTNAMRKGHYGAGAAAPGDAGLGEDRGGGVNAVSRMSVYRSAAEPTPLRVAARAGGPVPYVAA